MKKIAISFGILAALSLGACQDDFLEVTPTTATASADAFATTTNAWAALNGIHRSLYITYYDSQDLGGQGSSMLFVDAMGDDIVLTNSSGVWIFGTYRWQQPFIASNNKPYFAYRFYFTIISNANMIIDNVDGAEGPQADKDAIKAQALTYRAWSYFQMIQFFGIRYDANSTNDNPGVPLIVSSTTVEPKPRASVADVYEQINDDLDAAITLFGNASVRSNKSHFDLSVARGIKARVALTQQNYDVAAQMAHDARQGYSLMSEADYFSGFNDYTNVEWMWGSHQIPEQGTEFNSFFAYTAANFSSLTNRSNPKAINTLLFAELSNTDYRKGLWDPSGANTAFPIPTTTSSRYPYMTRKFLVKDPVVSSGDVPYMRASEMVLIEAEALARDGNDGDAADVLFELVKERDPSYTLSTNTGQALIDEIMIHRRVELWGEGFRFFDLKRLNQPLDRTGSNHTLTLASVLTVPAGDKRWQWVIPQEEINISNGLVTQNP